MKPIIHFVSLSICILLLSCNSPQADVDKLQSCVDELALCFNKCSCANTCTEGIDLNSLPEDSPLFGQIGQCIKECKKSPGTLSSCQKECRTAFFECANAKKE